MKKIVAMSLLGLCVGMTPVQANEFNISSKEEAVVAYGLVPNPIKVATKVITAPARAAKKKIDTARKVIKMGKKAGELTKDRSEGKESVGGNADAVEKSKKKEDKQFKEWQKHRDQELENIAKEKAERERLRKELGMEPTEPATEERETKDIVPNPEISTTDVKTSGSKTVSVEERPEKSIKAEKASVEKVPEKSEEEIKASEQEVATIKVEQTIENVKEADNSNTIEKNAVPSKE